MPTIPYSRAMVTGTGATKNGRQLLPFESDELSLSGVNEKNYTLSATPHHTTASSLIYLKTSALSFQDVNETADERDTFVSDNIVYQVRRRGYSFYRLKKI
jgi:hypothetical protein